ncbi:MAG: hypothetical protein K0S33_2382 [Bacteroidetes bacterium]|jgi:hypothetical protein|nr:hypothetical protein [Bacteroidota bacterium]
MGAWNYGIFDDDTAYDYVDIIENAEDPKEIFETSFEAAFHSDYLEYDECHAVTVSAAYMDAALNGTSYKSENDEEDNNINTFSKKHPGLQLNDLKASAVKALKIVLSDKSELNELWSENEELYPKWKGNLEELIKRLS